MRPKNSNGKSCLLITVKGPIKKKGKRGAPIKEGCETLFYRFERSKILEVYPSRANILWWLYIETKADLAGKICWVGGQNKARLEVTPQNIF